MKGWIKIHRKMLHSNIFHNEKLFKVFMYCLIKATHSDHKQLVGKQFVELKPGQFIFGRKKAALELNMKESTVRDYVELLKQDNAIRIESTNKYSVITVVNWRLYQGDDDDIRQQNDNKITTKRQQNDTNKNDKNAKNEKNDKEKILSEIENLRSQFSSDVQGLLKKYWGVIKKTRKTKTISNSVILKTMKKWTKYDDVVIQFALKTHIENYDDGERDEKYTLGIMRNTSKEEAQDRLDKVASFTERRSANGEIRQHSGSNGSFERKDSITGGQLGWINRKRNSV